MRKALSIFKYALLLAVLSCSALFAAKPAVLVLTSVYNDPMGPAKIFIIDPELEKQMKAKGYQVACAYYEDLTSEMLNKFNVVILVQEPWHNPDGPKPFETFAAKVPLIHKFIEQGGGAAAFFDEYHYTQNWDFAIHEFAKPLGMSFAAETIGDSNTNNKHPFEMINSEQGAYRTTNILKHEITEGVKSWWYPTMTRVLIGDQNWQTVVRGEKTSYTAKTYPSEPPLLSVRQYGKGRVAAFPEHSSFYVLNGFHRAYDGGWMFTQGDGWRLFENLLNWLAQPSIKAGKPGGYNGQAMPETQGQSGYRIEEKPLISGTKPMSGIIGIYTEYSGGMYSVRDFARAAKKAGLQFIAITDRIDSAEKWAMLTADCNAASDNEFTVIPGTEFETPWQGEKGVNTGFALNIDKWPPQWSDTFISVKLRTSEKYSPIITIAQPRMNSVMPWNIGAFQSLEIASCKTNEIYTSAKDIYKWYAGIPGVGWYPTVGHRIWSPVQLEEVARNGIKNYLYAAGADKVRRAPMEGLVPGFASDGPVIEMFRTQKIMADPWEIYYLWSPGELVDIDIAISDKEPLKEVSLYSGKELVRRFYPASRSFKQTVQVLMSQEGEFYLEAEDVKCRKAITYTIPTRNLNYWNHIGSDAMNDYHNPVGQDKYGAILFRGERYGYGGLVTAGYGWGNYIRFYHPVPTEAFHPIGYETGLIPSGLYNVRTYPRVYMAAKHQVDNPFPRRDCLLAGRDVAVLRETVDTLNDNGVSIESRYSRIKTDITLFRYAYRPYGYILMQVEPELTIKADEKEIIKLESRNGVEVGLLMLEYMTNKNFKYLTYVDESGKEVNEPVDLSKDGIVKTFRIGPGGYFALSPDRYGQVGLFALDKAYDVELHGGARPFAWVGFDMDGGEVMDGRKFTGRFVVMQEGAGQGPQICKQLAQSWGLSGSNAAKPVLSTGRIMDEKYIIAIEADSFGAKGKFTNPGLLANDLLPVTLEGVNGNWTCGSVCGGKFVPAGSFKGTMYVGLDNASDREYFLGNPVVADNNDLRIEVQSYAKMAKCLVHNPTSNTIKSNISFNKNLCLGKEVSLELAPGKTGIIELRQND